MPAPLAALAARLGPIVAQMAIGVGARGGAAAAGSRVPMGLTMAQGRMRGMGLSSTPPQQIGPQHIVPQQQGSQVASLLGNFAKAMPPVIASLVAFPPAARGFSNWLLESQRSLVQFNGAIASAFAALEIGRIQRSIRSGGATAGTTSNLADSTNRLEEALQPLGNLTTNIKNVFADALNEMSIFLLNGINQIVNPIAKAMFQQAAPNPAEIQMFLDNRRQEWIAEQNAKRQPALNLNRPNVIP